MTSCDNIQRPDRNNTVLTTTVEVASPSLVCVWWHLVCSVKSMGWPTSLPCYLWLLHCGTDLIKCFQPPCRAWSVVGKVKANILLSNEPGRAKLGSHTSVWGGGGYSWTEKIERLKGATKMWNKRTTTSESCIPSPETFTLWVNTQVKVLLCKIKLLQAGWMRAQSLF